jgi:hypothetical protein
VLEVQLLVFMLALATHQMKVEELQDLQDKIHHFQACLLSAAELEELQEDRVELEDLLEEETVVGANQVGQPYSQHLHLQVLEAMVEMDLEVSLVQDLMVGLE